MVMLSVPYRRTEPVSSFSTPLCGYINTSYGESDTLPYQDDIRTLDQLRSAIIINNDTSSSIHSSSLPSFIQYLGQLRYVAAKFPIDEHNIRIGFPWYSSFSVSKRPTTHYHLAYERASILFNIGALHSSIGTSQSLDDEYGIKQACESFRRAAGVFITLRSKFSDEFRGITPPMDMHPATLDCIINVMLAQAAELIWIKGSTSGSIKDALAARIATEIASLYQKAIDSVTNSQIALMDTMVHWINHINAKQALFSAHAQIRKAMDCQFKMNHGEAVARLQIAQHLITKQALSNSKYITLTLVNQIRTLEAQVNSLLTSSIKDNDVVYVQPVPKPENLSTIPSVPYNSFGAEVIEFIIEPNQLGRPLFESLVPYEVHKLANEYISRKDTYITQLIRDTKSWLASLQTKYHNTGCLGYLDASNTIDKGDTIPKKIIDRAYEFSSTMGGIQHLRIQIDALRTSAENSQNKLLSIMNYLDDEYKQDTEMKDQYNEKWVRTSSLILQRTIRDRLNELKDKLVVASESDKFIANKFEDAKIKLQLLESAALNGVESILPATSTTISPTDPLILSARTLVDKYESILEQIDTLFTELQTKSRTDDLTDDIIAKVNQSGSNNTLMLDKEPLFTKRLLQYNTFHDQLSLLRTQLESQLIELQVIGINLTKRMGNINESSSSLNNKPSRITILNDLNSAFDIAQEVTNNLKEGHQFYSDLMDVLIELDRQATDFVHARTLEKQELLSDLIGASSISSPIIPDTTSPNSTTQVSSVPPALPPRPVSPSSAPQNVYPVGVWKHGSAPPRFARN